MTAHADSEKVVEVHGAEVVKSNLLKFLQMDSKEALSFAQKNISKDVEHRNIAKDGKVMALESDFKGRTIDIWYEDNKIDCVDFDMVYVDNPLANSLEEAKVLLSEYGVSAKWQKDSSKESEVATKSMFGKHYFTSKIESKPVYMRVITNLQENTETVSGICVSPHKL
ncbi:hypothetical protein bcgnr5390_10900 [Bacillus luti]|nr:hypothetical protein BC2903_30010 [Bacillus cereus]